MRFLPIGGGEVYVVCREEKGTMAPVYGMAATLPLRGMVSDMLKRYLDLIFKA